MPPKEAAQLGREALERAHNEAVLYAVARETLLTEALRKLRDACDNVLAPLGYHGTICARDDRVSALMDVMHDTDDVLAKNPNEAPAMERGQQGSGLDPAKAGSIPAASAPIEAIPVGGGRSAFGELIRAAFKLTEDLARLAPDSASGEVLREKGADLVVSFRKAAEALRVQGEGLTLPDLRRAPCPCCGRIHSAGIAAPLAVPEGEARVQPEAKP